MLHDTRRVGTVKIQTTELNLQKSSDFVALSFIHLPSTSNQSKGSGQKDMEDETIL